jgi:cyclophilin family peptidyl-prolyl cis-trans isomerase
MRKKILLTILFVFTLSLTSALAADGGKPRIIMETSMGKMVIALFDDQAPVTCKNFRTYVQDRYFDGLIFHRVIPGFMIQGGGFEPGLKKRPSRAPIMNEAHNGLKNKRGTLSMARTNDINSATAQFFINVNDNRSLDHRSMRMDEYGYAVFGQVVEGMDVADAIVSVPRGQRGMYGDVPHKDVLILKMYEEQK